jgi:hypothetical protein
MIASIAKSGEGVKLGAVDHASLDLAMLDSSLAVLSDARASGNTAGRGFRLANASGLALRNIWWRRDFVACATTKY